MSGIVNLRRVRKAKARAETAAQAQANRTTHGISKQARVLAKEQSEKQRHRVDAHRLKDGDA
jgi:hypothetical protein